MRIPPFLKLFPGMAVLCLGACQCGPPEPALQVVINIDAAVPASCVVLEVTGVDVSPMTQDLLRSKDKNSFRIGIKKGSFPSDVQLRALSYTASAGTGCSQPRALTSVSATVAATFPRSDVGTATVEIKAPGSALDADGDLHIDIAKGGDDCNDALATIRPGLPAECGSTVDNDCDGKAGCNDTECGAAAICTMPATGLAYVTAAMPVAINTCSPALTVELRSAGGTAAVAPSDFTVAVSALPPTGVTLYSDANCATAATQVTIPTGQARGSFHFKATAAGAFDANATVLGLPTVTQTQTVFVPSVMQLVFTTPARSVAAGGCSSRLSLETQSSAGLPVPVTAASSIALSSNQAGVAFFSDSSCTMALTAGGLPLAAGATGGDFYVRPTSTSATTVTATLASVPAATQALTVTAGPPSQLAFKTAPQGVQSGACSSAVTIETRDANDNAAPVAAATNVTLAVTGAVTLGLFSDPTCATALTAPVALALGGSELSFYFRGSAAGTATLTATALALTAASQLETVGVGPPAKLVFTTAAQTTVAGQCSAAVTVQTQDAASNPSNVTGGPLGVTFTAPTTGFGLFTDPACATALAAPVSIAVGGTSATVYFRGTLSGSPRTLSAAAGTLTGATQNETVTPAAPTVLVFTSAVQSQVAGTCAQFDLAAQDAFGNPSAPAAAATVNLASTPSITFSSGATCAATVTSVSMAATTLTLFGRSTAAGAKNLTATAAFAMAAQTYTVTPGPAAQLGFTVQPTNAAAGAAIAPPIQVAIQDSFANTVTASTANVTIAIGARPGTGVLSGTVTAAAVAGVASFADLAIDKTGAGYTLGVTSATLTAATSNPFSITPGPATQLVFTAQPTTTTAGAAITPAVHVTVVDANNNVVTTSTASVTVAIGTNPGGGVLSGTATGAAVAGVATFPGLSIDKAGTGYTVAASSGTLAGATSASFSINTGPAARLTFTAQPTSSTAGATITPAVQVTVEDASGNRIIGSTATVAVAIGTNPGGGTLGGTVSSAAVAGLATFSNLNLDKSGLGYTLTATSGTLTAVTSTAFNIVAGPADRVAFFTQPVATASGASIDPSPRVEIQDALANRVLTSTANVTVAIANNAGPGGTLFGTLTIGAVAGLATFTNLSIDRVGTGYTLGASAPGLTAATSSAFNITPGPAAQLTFNVQPTTALAGAAISPAVQVTVQDLAGNTVTGSTANITVAIANNPSAGVLSGTATVAAVAGVASFSNLSINRTGTGYTLGASSGALTGATSASFNINPGPAAKLSFGVQPSNAVAATAIAPAITVRIEDASGNLVSSTANVTLAIAANPGTGTLSGTATVAAVAGLATFNNLSINKSGTGYTLGATSAPLTATTSNPFNITAGAAAALAWANKPLATTAGSAIAPAPQVEVVDAQGNRVLTSSATITLAIGTNPGTGTLSGTAAVAAVNGVSTFPGLSIDKSGVGYTLAATSGGLTGATSSAFDITAGTATQLVFTVQPTNTASTLAITPAVKVAVQDALNNTVLTSTASITVAIGTNPSSGVLSGTATVAAVAGVATFSNLGIDKAGAGYTLGATSAALTAALSSAFNITVGAAARLAILGTPLTVPALGCSPLRTVQLQDQGGNEVQSTGNTVLDAYTASEAGVTFYSDAACTVAQAGATRTIANNQSTTTFYFIADNPSASITLSANKTGLISGTQTATIGQGAPTALAFTTAAPSVEAGFCQPLTLERRDAMGRATSPTSATTAAVSANGPVAGILFFSDNLCMVALGATFDILSGASNTLIYTKGISGSLSGNVPGSQAYTVTATSTGLTNGTVIQTVAPMVRRQASACTLAGTSVNCAITPTLADTTRTLLVFQATTGVTDTSAGADNTSCYLDPNGGTAQVVCERNSDGNGDVNIEWQTVSFAYPYASGGVSVDHVTGGCTAGAANTMPINTAVSNVPTGSRFVLFSTRSGTGSTDNDADDFFTARLSSSTNLRVAQPATGNVCTETMTFHAQVVSWAGATVNRGVAGAGSGSSFTVSRTTPAPAQTFLLYTSRMVPTDTGATDICRRRLRGDINEAAGTLVFDRGCTGADVQDVAWEHVRLPSTSTVQKVAGAIASTATTSDVAISSVDLTRTVTFMGGMGPGGAATGRTDFNTFDHVGAALGRAVLSSATQLTFTRTTSLGDGAWVAFVVQLTP